MRTTRLYYSIRPGPIRFVLLFGAFLITVKSASAQVPDSIAVPVPDSTLQAVAPTDSMLVSSDSVQTRTDPSEGPTQQRPSSNKQPIQFTARDSMVITFSDELNQGVLIGEAKVGFEQGSMTAHHIQLNFDTNEMRAAGLQADSGLVGRPELTTGEETVKGRELGYNLDTEQGIIYGVQTTVEDGFVFGGVSKQGADSVIYIADAMYTTCNHEGDPHYHIRTSKMKIVGGKWIYTGPLHVRIFNVPLPLWLPFGFLPATEGRRSGPLPPTYGEDERGFYLRDFGWYWAMNDYMDLQVQGGIWTKGSWQISPQFRYNKRYSYSGRFSVDWLRERRGLSRDPDFTIRSTWSIRGNHNQTINPTSSLSADIDFSTSSFLRTVSRDYNDQVRQTIGSNIRYNKRWTAGGRSLTFFASQRQQLQTGGQVTLTLPQLSFSQTTRNPFKRQTRSALGERWYEKITYSYNGSLNNAFTFDPDTSLTQDIAWYDALFSGDQYEAATGNPANERFNFKASHRIPVAATFSVQRLPILDKAFRLNLSPNFSYTEDWYIRSDRKAINDSTGRVETTSVSDFTAIRQFSTGVSANSEFYGIFPFRVGSFEGFRHVVRPSAAFSYRPDYSSDFWGYYDSYVDTTGQEVLYPIISGIGRGTQKNLSFRLGNEFQTKRVRVDSTGQTDSRVVRLLTVDLSSSYNFAADSLRLSPMVLSARTNVLNQFDLNVNARFSPYQTNDQGRTIDQRIGGFFPFEMNSFNATVRTSIRSGNQTGPSRPAMGTGGRFGNGFNQTGYNDPFQADRNAFNTPVGYADFAIPWSLDLDMTYALTKTGLNTTRRTLINAGFDFNLTPRWKVQGRTGYDFIEDKVVTTNITILRDFHDWEMSLNWAPFGQFQSFQFNLNLKTGPLREILRLQTPKADIRNRFRDTF